MINPWIQILTGALGTLGFALCSHVRAKHLVTAALGGLLAWGIYLVVYHASASVFLGNLIAAMGVYAWSECMARIMKAPVTIFLVPGIIPLLPGSFLYYTVLALLNHETAQFLQYGGETVYVTMGIACGVVFASILVSYFIRTMERLHAGRSKN